MSKPIKIALAVAAIVAFSGIYIVLDWYRFATAGTIDKNRGIYGNDHLEVWIDVNARMPAAMRLWACETLREREKAVLGGRNSLPPHSCQPDFGTYATPASYSEAVIGALVHGATALAAQQGATDEKVKAVDACMTAALKQAVTPEQLAALDAKKAQTDAMIALNAAATGARKGCLAKVGL